MPYPTEHSARLKDPKQYDEFRRQNDKFGKGIHAIFGIKKSPPRKSELQAIRFDAKKFTVKEAKDWLKKHNHKYIRFEPASGGDKKSLVEKYNCECIKCGYKMSSEKHCKDLKCPECGGQMRREERPGPGQEKQSESIPNLALRFREEDVPVEIAELKEGDGKKKRKFSMVAHSGRVMLNHWFWGNFAIDLNGISIGRRKKPALRDHNSNRIIGWTEDITIDAKRGIVAEGIFSERTEDGREALELADEGFPWQASIYIPPVVIERISDGQEAEVNGYKLKGPGTIFRKSILREVSFCALGADENTQANAFKDKGDEINLDIEVIETGEEVKKEMELSELTVESLKTDRSDLVDAILKEGKEIGSKEGIEAGVKQERKRILAIQEKAKAFEGVEDLASELIADGASVEDAISKFKDKRIEDLQKNAPKSTGPGDDPNSERDLSSLSGEDKYKEEWRRDPKLAEEFTSESAYIAFRKAEERGAVRIMNK